MDTGVKFFSRELHGCDTILDTERSRLQKLHVVGELDWKPTAYLFNQREMLTLAADIVGKQFASQMKFRQDTSHGKNVHRMIERQPWCDTSAPC